MRFLELTRERFDEIFNNHPESVDILLSKDNCPFCVKVKSIAEELTDLEGCYLTINLDNPEFEDFKQRLINQKIVSFVPTLLRYTKVDGVLTPRAIVDDELYEVLFDGRVQRTKTKNL